MKVKTSRAVSEITYQERTRNLYVHFTDGTSYVYRDVPKDVYERFLEAQSKGRYYNAEVRDKFFYDEL